jgi:2-polyprenyl-3-methyl-5-hydroxy-6-metoxy-1,4-benzoquinol methylase
MNDVLSPDASRRRQVEIEGQLAQRLTDASASERRRLYGQVYDQIYDMHLTREPLQLDFGARIELVKFLRKLTRAGDSVLEVGCGGGLLAIELARQGRQVLGVDVSARILEQARHRAGCLPGLTFALTEGTDLPAAEDSFDLAYSVEVIEHLHADDVSVHLREVRRVLKPGGHLWLLTPNRLDSVGAAARFGVALEPAADVHLKEWTYAELGDQLRAADFTSLRSPWRNATMAWLPLLPARWFAAAERLPPRLLGHRSVRTLAGLVACSIVAEKPR